MFLKPSSPMSLRVCAMKYFEPNEYHVTRVHRYSVLILMLEGVLRFFENGQPIELRAGDYYIQRAGLLQEGLNVHKLSNSDAPAVYYFVEFQGGEFSETVSGLPIRGRFKTEELQPLIDACIAASINRHASDPFLLHSYLHRFFSALYHNDSDNNRISELLGMVRRFIDSEYSSIKHVDDIAKKFGYHRDYLTKLFSEKYHMTVFGYLKKVRMEHALWLLQHSEIPPPQISELVGYSDYSSFYRAFSATFHIAPNEARSDK